jgi:basic amino acid/polyamine antiporter, APA family
MILAAPRVYYAMAKDGLFFKKVASLNNKGVPSFAIILQGVWSILLCLSGTYNNLLDYVTFAMLLFLVLTIFAIFILRKKRPEIDRPYKAFGYPIIPAVYILTILAILAILILYKPEYTLMGLAIVLMGIPVFFLWKKFNRNGVEIQKSDMDL